MDSSSGYGRSQGPSLFVGGLAFNATEQDVREAFAPCGTVTSCRIVTDRETGRSKGFGFVEFASEDSIERAVRDFNGMTICGRQVRLDSGGKGKGKGGGGARPSYDQPRPTGGYDGGRSSRPPSYQEPRGYSQGDNMGGGYQGQQQAYPSNHGGYQGSQAGQGGQGGYQGSHGGQGGYQGSQAGQGGHSGYQGSQGGHGGYQQGGAYQAGGSSYQSQGYNSRQQYSGPPGSRREEDQQYNRRSRSRSLSSGTKERRHRERQARKEQFARSNRGWDRMPTSEEVAYQEAERAAVHAAEAQGKDITTIRADLLKQASYAHHHH